MKEEMIKEEYFIEITYGSEHQKETYDQMLGLMIATLKIQMESRHKDNKVNWKIKLIKKVKDESNTKRVKKL